MNKMFAAIMVFIGYISFSHAALPLEQLLYKGMAVPFYGDAASAGQQQLLDAVKRSNLAERMASMTNLNMRLKHNIGVGFESCGSINAFFSPQRRAVVICTEFVEMVVKLATNDKEVMGKMSRESFVKAIDGLIWGIYFHELAHALITTNGIPITGREEDVADQFAVWFSLNFMDLSRTPILMPTIWFWRELGKGRNIPAMNQDELRHFMSDEHSLNEQRVYNMACWAYGTNSALGNAAAKYAGLPEQRAQRCASEYETADRGMMMHFKKYLKVKPLSGRW